MGFLFADNPKEIPAITGLQIQTAVNILPIPLIYGMPRIVMNVIYMNGFRSVPPESGGKGGKGFGGKGSASNSTKYYATFIGALGEGVLGTPVLIFDNQSVYPPASAPREKDIAAFFPGSTGQAAWSVITARWPADAFGYKNTSYLGFDDYLLDVSATIPQLGFVLPGKFQGTCPLNIHTVQGGLTFYCDADPAAVIYDFLTNVTYGAGFPANYIDTTTLNTSSDGFNSLIGDSALATYCQAVGLGWSIVLNNFEPATSILERWCKNLVVAPVWTGSLLKFIPYYDTFSGVNPGWGASAGVPLKYFAPNITSLFDLDDDNFLQTEEGDDPVVTTRNDIADVKNVFRVDYKDRLNYFNSTPREVQDDNAIELYNVRTSETSTAEEFTHPNYAGVSAQLQLNRSVAIRNRYSFKLGPQFCVLEPMDIVTITDSILGLDKLPIRIEEIEEDEKGVLTFICEEFPIGSMGITAFSGQDNLPPPPPVTNVEPGAVNTPFIFEPTVELMRALSLPTLPTLALGVSGGPSGVFDPDWGGCHVFLSNDGVTYMDQGALHGPSRHGITTAILPSYSGTNPDTVNTLSVNLSESNGVLNSVTADQAALGLSVCVVGDGAGGFEFVSYTTATLTGANTYNLTGLYRGLYGTVPCSHGTGNQILRLDTDIFSGPLPPAFLNTVLYVKLPSFNIFNQMHQDISTCTVYVFTPPGSSVDLMTNLIWAALSVSSSVDLNTFLSNNLDLNTGGAGECSPTLGTVDLN